MKVLVTYLSKSGNTKKVAQAIYDGLDGSKELRPMSEVESTDGYDMLFVGFPIVGAGAPGAAKRFLARVPKGKRVALFITHGMPMGMKKLGPMMEKCKEAAEGKELVGVYDCQGKMVKFMALVLRLYPDRDVRRWVAAGEESIGFGHPNVDELSRATTFGRSVAV